MPDHHRLSYRKIGARVGSALAVSTALLFTPLPAAHSQQVPQAQEHNPTIGKSEHEKDGTSDAQQPAPPTPPPSSHAVGPSEQEPTHKKTKQPAPEQYETWIDAGIAWTIQWVKKWLGDPGYVFASIVAIFTLFLWKATSGLWRAAQEQSRDLKRSIDLTERTAKAAEMSADALPILERAHLFLVIFNAPFRTALESITRRINSGDQNASIKQVTVTFWFVNHGKTPAIVKEISAGISHREKLPERISDAPRERIAGDLVIPSGGKFPTIVEIAPVSGLRASNEFPITSADIEIINKGGSFLFFYGRIVYEDIFGEEHVTPYCWRYEAVPNEFRPYGPKEYNQRT